MSKCQKQFEYTVYEKMTHDQCLKKELGRSVVRHMDELRRTMLHSKHPTSSSDRTRPLLGNHERALRSEAHSQAHRHHDRVHMDTVGTNGHFASPVRAELRGELERTLPAHQQPHVSARLHSRRLLFAARCYVHHLLEDLPVGQVSHPKQRRWHDFGSATQGGGEG